MKTNNILIIGQWAFWAFYIIFLLSSVPHLADWFRHMDGVMPQPADAVYWTLAYGKAVAVDGADVLLTLAFLNKINDDDKNAGDWGKIVFIVLFILGFTGFSWYINWQYAIQFSTPEFAQADAATNLFGQNVGASNPAVASAMQLFALVFTFISDTLMQKGTELSAVQVLEKAREKQQLNAAMRQLRQAKKEDNEQKLEALFGSLNEVIGQVKKVGKDEELTMQSDENGDGKEERNTEPIAQQSGQDDDGNSSEESTVNAEQTPSDFEINSAEMFALRPEIIEVVKTYPKMAAIVSASGSTVPLSEVVSATDYTLIKLRNRVRKGEVKSTPRGKDIVFKDSLFTWLNTDLLARQNASKTPKIIHLKTSATEETLEQERA